MRWSGPAKAKMGGRLMRVVGSLDPLGQGTEFPIPHLGAFVMVEDARRLPGPGVPDFGMHPHSGLLACSYIPEGGPWEALSNLSGAERERLEASQVAMLAARRGVVHDEHTGSEGEHSIVQIILRLPSARWELDSSLRVSSATIVAQGDDAGEDAGEDAGAGAGADVAAAAWRLTRIFDAETLGEPGLDASMYRVEAGAGARVRVPLAAAHDELFVYVREGPVSCAGRRWETGTVLHFDRDSGCEGALELSSLSGSTCDVLVGSSAALAEVWVKRLGHDGFVVAADLEAARAKLEAFARDPATFGR